MGVDDIFGGQSPQQAETYSFTAPETRCDELRACVECSAFHQYWHTFASALECSNACNQWTFVNEPRSREGMCTMQYEPHCGIDGRVYSNKCEVRGGLPPCTGRVRRYRDRLSGGVPLCQ